jgi:Cu/Zn superoxide dismutase
MRTRLSFALAALAAAMLLPAGIAVAASAMSNMHAATTARVHLSAENHSGQNGTATLVQKGKDVIVTLTITGIPHGVAEPAHIHPGTCAHLNPKPAYPLTNAAAGSTTTVLKNLMLGSLMGGKYAINVHDRKNLARYVSCGNIT